MNKNVEHSDDVILLEDEMEDDLLARALEESLRHYREVELPYRQSQEVNIEKPQTRQDSAQGSSRTSLSADLSMETILYAGQDAEGFDLSAGHNWIYPTNYPIREYQFNIDNSPVLGSMAPNDRAVAWKKKRVFFLTPQVLTNDLTCGICPAASIKCIVVDEAHKAQGSQSYCQVMKALFPFNNKFRVLALSATPGNDMNAVTQIVDKHLGYLIRQKLVYGSMQNLTKFGLLQAREAFRKNPPSNILQGQRGNVESSFAIGVTLLHSLELLSLHGLRSFLKFLNGVINEERGQVVVQNQLKHETDLQELLEELKAYLGPENQEEPEPDVSMAVPSTGQLAAPIVYSHPKLEKLQEVVVGHFRNFQEKNVVTRAMIFCQYRDTVIEICHILQRFQPLVKPMTFIGQSSNGKQSKGFTQKQQLKVMHKFRVGGYNTLISTCVGEEGLDIGEVDLIVCYDAHKSPIRLVQRMGRTGRKREGRIVMLITEGREYSKYKAGMSKSNSINKNLLDGNRLAAHMYSSNPRMVPVGVNPKCYQMFITPSPEPEKKTKKKKNQDIRKLFGRTHGNKEAGSGNIPYSSPYCTAKDLEEMGWDGKTVPQFNMLSETEELHSMNADDLRHIFDTDFVSYENEDSQKINFKKFLEWQRHLQQTGIVPHTVNSQMFIDLLNYADQKRCDELPPTQAEGLMSQVNTSALWKKKKGKRKGVVNKKKSNNKCIGKKNQITSNIVVDKNPPFLFGTDGLGTPITEYFKVPAPVNSVLPSISEKTECHDNAPLESSKIPAVVNSASTSKTVENSSMVIEDVNSVGHCYFCKTGLFDCSVVTPYVDKNTKRVEIEKYEPIDLSCLGKISKEFIASLDINELVTPPSSPVNDIFNDIVRLPDLNSEIQHMEGNSQVEKSRPNFNFQICFDQSNDEMINKKLNTENTLLNKSTKIEAKSKSSFQLNFSLFDQCLFDEELEPQDDIRASTTPTKLSSKYLGNQNNVHVQDDKARMLNDVNGDDEIKMIWRSPNVSPWKSTSELTEKDNTPAKTKKQGSSTTGECLNNEFKIILSPVSPILGSQRKRKSCPEKQEKTLPTSSTPKVHRKNLFSKITFEDDKEDNISISKEKYVTATEFPDEKDESIDNVGLSLSKPPNLPQINFDLGSCTQFFDFGEDEQESDVSGKHAAESMQRTATACNDITSNTSMYTVTQIVAMVDKPSRNSENNNSNLVVSNNVNLDHDLMQLKKSSATVETSNSKHVAHYKQITIENNTVHPNMSPITEEVSKKNIPEQKYFLDSEDDMFADLSGDCEDDIFCGQKSEDIDNDTLRKKLQADSSCKKSPLMTGSMTHQKMKSPSIAQAVPVEKMKNSNTGVHCLSRKLVPEYKENTKSSLNEDKSDYITEKSKQKTEISSKEEILLNQKEYKRAERITVDSVTPSIPLNMSKNNIKVLAHPTIHGIESLSDAVPPDSNASNNTPKLILSLKLKPKTTLDNSSEQQNSIVSQCIQKKNTVLSLKLTPKESSLNNSFEERHISQIIHKQTNDKIVDEICNGENITCNNDVKDKEENSLFDSQFSSFLIPGFANLPKNMPTTVSAPIDASTKSRLSLKRKVKSKCPQISSIDNVDTTERKNESFTTPEPKKFKLDQKSLLEVSEIDYKKMFLSGVKNTSMSSPVKTGKQLVNQNVRSIETKGLEIRLSNNLISEDDSPIARPFVRKKTVNISITSNESIGSPKRKHTYAKEDALKEITSESFQICRLNAKANNISTSSEENNNSRIISNIKQRKNEFVNKRPHTLKSVDDNVHCSLSEDSDFESQTIARQNKSSGNGSVDQEQERAQKNKARDKKQKQSAQRCPFVESEAEESDNCPASSDGENTSGLDEYDSSFVSESGTQTHTDIQAKFLNSMIRQDSFCVEGEDFTEMMDESILEVAEAVLEAKAKRKKRKRKKANSCSSEDSDCVIVENVEENKKNNVNKHKKRRRIITLSSSDSDEDERKISFNKEIQSQRQNTVSTFQNNERQENSKGNGQHKVADGKVIGEVQPFKQLIIDRLSPITASVSKGETTSVKEIISELAFDDWDFDIFSLSKHEGKQEKSEEKTGVKEKKNKNDDDAHLQNDWDFELGGIDELFQSPVLSCSNKPQNDRNQINPHFDNIEFGDHDGALVSPVLSCSGRPRKSSNKETCISPLNVLDSRTLEVSPILSCSGQPKNVANKAVRSLSIEFDIRSSTSRDFMHGGPSKNGLGTSIRILRAHFMKQVLILENDKMIPVATTSGLRREMWSKSAVHYIACLRQAGVHVLYSTDKADTARLIAKLAQSETMKECGIKSVAKDIPGLDARLQFYRNLPNMNMALAMQLCHKFSRIVDFLDSCNTVKKIQDILGLDGEKAVRIYLVLHRIMKF
ncbi:hypothetical protein C0J52_01093 [Blattella germanica]|nr:hypothetical protein C0J52_01093 [Blattella germanica]